MKMRLPVFDLKSRVAAILLAFVAFCAHELDNDLSHLQLMEQFNAYSTRAVHLGDNIGKIEHHTLLMQSAIRGFLINNDSDFVQQFVQAEAALYKSIDSLRAYTFQTEYQDEAEAYEKTALASARFNIQRLEAAQQENPAKRSQLTNQGKTLMDSLEMNAARLMAHIDKNIRLSIEENEQRSQKSEHFDILIFFFIVLLTLTAYFSLVTHISKEDEMRKDIQDLYDNAPIGYLSLNSEGLIVAMNRTHLNRLGYSREEVVGRMNILDLLNEDGQETFKAAFPKMVKHGGSMEAETLHRKKSGEWLHVRLLVNTVFDAQGNFLRTRTAVLDISERKKLEEQIAEIRAVERTAQLKEEFVANISHEIRTPLHAIIGFSQLLERSELSPKQRQYALSIQNSSKTLLLLVDDVLNFSKTEAGAVRIEQVEFDLPQLMRSIKKTFESQAAEKKLKLMFCSLSGVPSMLTGDPARLMQVLSNLISNALKFTVQGGVDVSAKVVEEYDDLVLLQFSIKDTGVGIEPEYHEKIFERFHQIRSGSRKFGGVGLGLPIVKQLVEMQNGTVRVESEPGKGATFVVTLPFGKPEQVLAPTQKNMAGATPQKMAGGLRLLVAEDNPVNRQLMEAILLGWGVQFDIVGNGKLAIEAMRKINYDLLLLDLQMPEMDGYETARVIRQELRSEVPIVALTAQALPGEREKCLGSGMNEYVVKPFQMDDLYRLISRLTAPVPFGNAINNLLQSEYLQTIGYGKPDFLEEMRGAFLQQVAKEMAAIENALAAHDYPTLLYTAHSMKSTFASIGLSEIALDAAAELEIAANRPHDTSRLSAAVAQLRQICEKAVEEMEVKMV